MTSIACGVDFGTSNSTVGWSRPDQTALLALEDGKPTLPSAIFFHDDDDLISYGRAALADYLADYEGRLMRSMKSLLGSAQIDGHTEVRGRQLPFRTLLTQYIAELKRRGEQAAGRRFEHAVIGRPVFFVDENPEADRLAQDTLADIAHSVGFEHVEFQYEPLAAAFAYEAGISREALVLVVDVGGGTSDFSLVRLGPQRVLRPDRRDDILASGGVHIGGTDFDKLLSLACVMPEFGLGSLLKSGKLVPSAQYFNLACWHTINNAYTRKAWSQLVDVRNEAVERDRLDLLLSMIEQRAGHWLAMQVESAKITLSQADAASVDLARILPEKQIAVARDEFDAAIDRQIGRIETTIGELLRQAGVAAGDVDTVFFTGGSSRVPLLRERVAALAPGASSVEGDLFGSIGTGLAMDAARKFG